MRNYFVLIIVFFIIHITINISLELFSLSSGVYYVNIAAMLIYGVVLMFQVIIRDLANGWVKNGKALE